MPEDCPKKKMIKELVTREVFYVDSIPGFWTLVENGKHFESVSAYYDHVNDEWFIADRHRRNFQGWANLPALVLGELKHSQSAASGGATP
jgi:hypothetical protein